MELKTISKPYANAVFNKSLQDNNIKDWHLILNASSSIVQDNNAVGYISSPKVSKVKKYDFIVALVTDITKLDLSNEQQNFFNIVVNNNRLNALPTILEQFNKLEATIEKEHIFEIISAYPLSDKEQNKLLTILSNKYSCKANLKIKIDKNLIGGIVIKDGDKVINGTISQALEEFSNCLSLN